MKRNAEFNIKTKSRALPDTISFSQATEVHIQEIFELMSERNPDLDRDELLARTKREILELCDGKLYGLCVATLDNKVVGFCRFFHSDSVPKEKIKFPHPRGMFSMGIVVHPEYRRMNIARFLSDERNKIYQALGLKKVFSAVAKDNPTSIRMHEEFGYQAIEEVPGVMMVTFDCGEGIIFQKNIN